MARTPSVMIELGTKLPSFRLPDVDGRPVASDDVAKSKGLLVMFICNHCPFVKHLHPVLGERANAWVKAGLGVVAISSNDAVAYPEDSPEKMKQESRERGFGFPYLFDETQSVAKAFRAACTPDFFLFDGSQRLVYRGQFDASRPGNGKAVNGEDLERAVQALLANKPIDSNQMPSIGCNIKWRA